MPLEVHDLLERRYHSSSRSSETARQKPVEVVGAAAVELVEGS